MSFAVPEVSRWRSLADSGGMIRNPIEVFSRHTRELGETFYFYFGGVKKALVTSNPEVLRHVLKTNYENYHKSEIQIRRMGHFLGKGLLTTHGEPWKVQRRLIQQGFHREQLAILCRIMRESLDETLAEFDRAITQGPVDIYPRMMQMTFRMVSRSLFSTAFDSRDADLISRTICEIQEFMVRQIVQPYLDPWFAINGELAKYDRMRERGDAILMRAISRRRAENEAGETSHGDLLQMLMDARYADTGEGMDDQTILSESMQLLVAGHETSSNALCWTLLLLATHPETLARVKAEVESVLGGRPLELADVPRMEFAAQAIDESLRLFPPFWMVDRMALSDDEAGGVEIPKGTTVIAFIHGVHHSAKYWDAPEEFRPARFEREAKKRHAAFTHLPFGGGPRGCIGGNYAMLQMLMILSELVRRYDFSLAPGTPVEPRPMIILRPKDGIRMTFSPAESRAREAAFA
ncbi:MAG: cytochrome P450 [Bryobacteraceae bacterium]|nr:cytochrome P450 [Bryobacteraceae bacterium]